LPSFVFKFAVAKPHIGRKAAAYGGG